MEEAEIVTVIKEILNIDVGDEIRFTFQKIEPIREADAYNNFRVHMDAIYGKIKNPMKIDITTGDEITPGAIQYHFPFLFENKSVPIMAYTLEQMWENYIADNPYASSLSFAEVIDTVETFGKLLNHIQ